MFNKWIKIAKDTLPWVPTIMGNFALAQAEVVAKKFQQRYPQAYAALEPQIKLTQAVAGRVSVTMDHFAVGRYAKQHPWTTAAAIGLAASGPFGLVLVNGVIGYNAMRKGGDNRLNAFFGGGFLAAGMTYIFFMSPVNDMKQKMKQQARNDIMRSTRTGGCDASHPVGSGIERITWDYQQHGFSWRKKDVPLYVVAERADCQGQPPMTTFMTIHLAERFGTAVSDAQNNHFDQSADEKYEVKAAQPTTEIVIPKGYARRDTGYVWGDCGAYRGERSAKKAAATCSP